MESLQLLLSVLFYVSVFSQEGMPYVKVILGDPFTLPENCPTDVEGTLRRQQPESRHVAAHRRGVWIPEEGFKDRINQSSSVVFNRAVYTDSGVYVLTCGGREVHIQVEVVVSSEASVKEGAAVSLPCYYPTTVGTCWSVRWVKDREDVLQWKSCDVKSNRAADDRLSLSAEWLPHGDLSLNLQQARKNDEGDYFCYIQREGRGEQRENPAAVRLKVSKRSPDQITSTLPPPPVSVSSAQKPCEVKGLETPAAAGTAVACLIAGAVVAFLLTCCYFKRASVDSVRDDLNLRHRARAVLLVWHRGLEPIPAAIGIGIQPGQVTSQLQS